MTESKIIQKFLDKKVCDSCLQHYNTLKLTKECYYTNPLIYVFECTKCHAKGEVGYSDMSKSKIEMKYV